MKDTLSEDTLSQIAESVIVTDTGFRPADPDAFEAGSTKNLSPDVDLDGLIPQLSDLTLIRIGFPSFADGRGFTIARRLRQLGYRGHLRAKGHVLADQFAMARRSGFDDVEIDGDLAARQPEDQWLARANWRDHDLRSRLRAA